jgi:hypothetical protein
MTSKTSNKLFTWSPFQGLGFTRNIVLVVTKYPDILT